MENRFFHFFLRLLLLLSVNSVLFAAEENSILATSYEAKTYQKPDIDVDDFELVVSMGFLSIEDFGVDNVVTFNLNYHINETFFIQAGTVIAEASETSFEKLTGNSTLLTNAEKEFNSYYLDVGYNLFIGEGFFSQHQTFSTDYYLIAGIGSTEFAGNDRFTYNYGAGFKAAVSSWFTLTSEFRNYVFDIDVFGTDESTNNLSFTFGIGFVF